MSELSKMPDFNGMTPKKMLRAWLRFMADNDWPLTSPIHHHAEMVRLSLETMVLNYEHHAVQLAQKAFLEERNKFEASLKGG